MADNVPVSAGSGLSIAADDIGGVHYQRVKLSIGADGSATDALGGSGTASAAVLRTVSSTDDPGVVQTTQLAKLAKGEYETVAASQTSQALGATGATGDFISHLIVVPATPTPGIVTLLDNAISIPVFLGGATYPLANVVPFVIPLGMVSVSGAWRITTGASVSVIAVGDFT
jgi:hypothetical protein